MSLVRCNGDIDRRIGDGSLTIKDADMIKRYLAEQKAVRNLSDQSILTEYNSITPWTKQLSLFSCTIDDIYTARNTFAELKQNTQRTYIAAGKRFFLWKFQKNKSIVLKINAIRIPLPDRMTKTASQMLTQETIDQDRPGIRTH